MCERCSLTRVYQREHMDGALFCLCRYCTFPLRLHCNVCGHDCSNFKPKKVLPGQWVRRGQQEGWVRPGK